jgi:WD40 repeat protein
MTRRLRWSHAPHVALILTLLLVHAASMRVSADPWQVTTRCAVSVDAPAPLKGVILMHDPDAGVRALRAGVATTYFIAFEGSNFTGAGAMSPDGRWFAIPHGNITIAAAFDVRYRVTELRLHSTEAVPQIRRRIPWDANFQAGSLPRVTWLDADTLLYPEGEFNGPLTGITLDPLADPLEKVASSLAAYSVLAPDQQSAIGRFEDTYALYDTASGWVRQRLPDLTQFAWSPDSTRFAAVQSIDGAAALVVVDAADVGARVLLTLAPDVVVRNLHWSPDGAQIAFSLFDPQENENRLYVGDVDGGTLKDTCILLYPGVPAVAWSPDGNRLALVALDGRLEIYEPAADQRYATTAGFSGGLIGWGAG